MNNNNNNNWRDRNCDVDESYVEVFIFETRRTKTTSYIFHGNTVKIFSIELKKKNHKLLRFRTHLYNISSSYENVFNTYVEIIITRGRVRVCYVIRKAFPRCDRVVWSTSELIVRLRYVVNVILLSSRAVKTPSHGVFLLVIRICFCFWNPYCSRVYLHARTQTRSIRHDMIAVKNRPNSVSLKKKSTRLRHERKRLTEKTDDRRSVRLLYTMR